MRPQKKRFFLILYQIFFKKSSAQLSPLPISGTQLPTSCCRIWVKLGHGPLATWRFGAGLCRRCANFQREGVAYRGSLVRGGGKTRSYRRVTNWLQNGYKLVTFREKRMTKNFAAKWLTFFVKCDIMKVRAFSQRSGASGPGFIRAAFVRAHLLKK